MKKVSNRKTGKKPAKAPAKQAKVSKLNNKPSKTKKPSGIPPQRAGRPKKSATMRSVEKTQKLQQTMKLGGLGGLTAQLPDLNLRPLDRPVRRSKPRKRIEFDWSDISFLRDYKKTLIIVVSVVAVVAITLGILLGVYTVDTVTVEGNVHYNNEEIYHMVIGDNLLEKNSLYLKFKYHNKDIKDIPFIETMNVKITSPSSIRVIVYEKALAGYVEHLGRYFYFDKDGTVVESSSVMTAGIPQVLGLKFDHIVLYESLPVENEDIFNHILDMSQLLSKYEIATDKIYFDNNYNMTLYFDEARVSVGSFDYIDEKIIRLRAILPELEGRRGVLKLDNYKGGNESITFKEDKN